MLISENVLRAPLRDNEVCTTINVPSGATAMQFYSELTVYARKGASNAEPPDSSTVNDGSASFPYPGGAVYEVSVTGGDRCTFVTAREAGVLHVAFT